MLYLQAFGPVFVIGMLMFAIARSAIQETTGKVIVLALLIAGGSWALYCTVGLGVPHEWMEKVWLSATMLVVMVALVLGAFTADMISSLYHRLR